LTRNAQVVCTTTSTAGSYRFKRFHCNSLIIDEAEMDIDVDVLIPLPLHLTRSIFVGDVK
jgi:superfamily I DNA and/or RNA helicase